jgi:hypothetical protein
VEAAHRSIHPNVPGVPWWAAVLIATTATAIGYAIDAGSGHKELTNIFAGLYIAGCVIGVLAVRQAGVFSAVIQPPLILFCAVPGAYWLFHGGKIRNIKDLLINCGYPLIERFPLMVGTAGGVVLIGLVRWYFGTTQPTRSRTTPAAKPNDDAARVSAGEPRSAIGGLGLVAAKLTAFLRRDHDDLADEGPSTGAPRVEPVSRPPRTSRPARGGRPAARSARTHSRHARPAPEDEYGPTTEHPRRQSRRRQPPPAPDFDAADPPRRPRRRPRPQGDPDPRAQQPQEMRRDPYGRRNPYERPTSRTGRYDPHDGYEPAGPPEQFGPYQRPYEQHESYGSYEQPRGRGGPNSANPTHHPISQVRYRGSGGSTPRDEPHSERRDEPRAERRNRSRAPGRPQNRHSAENWEYDI